MADIQEFVAHYGVKGQRWGVRKRRSTASDRSPSSPSQRHDKAKKVAIALGVAGVGTVAALAILKASGNTRLSAAKASSAAGKRVVNSVGNRTVASMATSRSSRPASPAVAKLLAEMKVSVKEANEGLKGMYESNMVPLHMREYMPDW